MAHRNAGNNWKHNRDDAPKYTGPAVIPASGMDRLGSVEFRQWMAQQARILGDAMRDENEMVNRKLEDK